MPDDAVGIARAHEAAHPDGKLGDRLRHGERVAAIAVLVVPLMDDGARGRDLPAFHRLSAAGERREPQILRAGNERLGIDVFGGMLDPDQHGHAAPATAAGIIRKSSWICMPSALLDSMKEVRNSCRPERKMRSMRPYLSRA